MVTAVTAFHRGSLMVRRRSCYSPTLFHSSKTKKEKRRPTVNCRPLSREHRCLFRSHRRHHAVIAVTQTDGTYETESK
jgi:hypothetical protein